MQGWANVHFKRTFRSDVLFRLFQKNVSISRSFQKNVLFSAFISVFCKRTFRSLRFFLFFAKECFILCVLFCSLQKNVSFSPFFYENVKERNVHLGFISRQKFPKTGLFGSKKGLFGVTSGSKMAKTQKRT